MSHKDSCCSGPGYETPLIAMKEGPREKLLYVPALPTGNNEKRHDYLATIDVDPSSKTYSQVIHRLPMPNIGDELHHTGWNACSSCHGDSSRTRRYLILPGLLSGRFNVVDIGQDEHSQRSPKIYKVVNAAEIQEKDKSCISTHCSLFSKWRNNCLMYGRSKRKWTRRISIVG